MNDEMNQQEQEENLKLYAGKFKSIEELEAGYKNSAKVYQENEELKKQLENYKTPEDYDVPTNIELKQINEIKTMAKNAGLTQQQFEKLVMDTDALNRRAAEAHKQMFEEKVKAIGDENLNLLKDYVSKSFPEAARDEVLRKFILDDNARSQALRDRESRISNSIPGISNITAAAYSVTYDDVLKAREASLKNPGNQRLRENYLKLMSANAAQKRASSQK